MSNNTVTTTNVLPSESSLPRINSAGILPYSINGKGEISFLLGREGYAPGWYESDMWSSFSGVLKTGESVVEGAAREGYEETAGILYLLPELRQKLKNGEFRLAIDVIFKNTRYICYFVQVPYRDYPTMFRHVKQFVQYTGGNVACIEKTQLRWFSSDDMHKEIYNLPDDESAVEENGQFRIVRYGKRPVFRKKFKEMMKFFFETNGQKILANTGRYQAKYLHVRMGQQQN